MKIGVMTARSSARRRFYRGLLMVKRLLHCTAVLFALLLAGCGERGGEHGFQGAVMGTSWSFKLFEEAVGEDEFAAIASEAARRLDEIEAAMSTYIGTSQVSRFNASRSTEWQAVSSEVVEVVAYAQRISELSGGAFDITVAPLVELWGFAGEAVVQPPAAAAVARARRTVGYRHLSFRRQPPALRKDVPELRIDLAAIAKGFAVDRVVDILHRRGIKNYLVEVGGELRASGRNQELEPWRVGVEKPTPGWREVMRAVQLDGIGIATSGDYRNFIELDGKRYSHEIDPHSGRPMLYRGVSVTVIAPTAMAADAWATGLFVTGKEKGMKIARDQGLAVYYIEQTGDGFVQTMNKAFSRHLAAPQGG